MNSWSKKILWILHLKNENVHFIKAVILYRKFDCLIFGKCFTQVNIVTAKIIWKLQFQAHRNVNWILNHFVTAIIQFVDYIEPNLSSNLEALRLAAYDDIISHAIHDTMKQSNVFKRKATQAKQRNLSALYITNTCKTLIDFVSWSLSDILERKNFKRDKH